LQASRFAFVINLRSRAHEDEVLLCVLDLLELDGEDWRPRPLKP
jgi:ATP-dependent DNA ligase